MRGPGRSSRRWPCCRSWSALTRAVSGTPDEGVLFASTAARQASDALRTGFWGDQAPTRQPRRLHDRAGLTGTGPTGVLYGVISATRAGRPHRRAEFLRTNPAPS
jgi:hypothetical protein